MSDAVAVSVAKAVTSRIAAATLSQQFVLERSYADWDLDLSNPEALELDRAEKLRVDVVSHTTEQAVKLSARDPKVQYTVPIDIAVRQKFELTDQDADTGRVAVTKVDELMLLVQEIHVLFTAQRLADTNLAVWDGENGGTNILAAPMRQHLRELRQFTGLVRIVFRADVAI